MGWRIDIKTDKRLTLSAINKAIKALPRSIRGDGGQWFPEKQKWGWSLAVDVAFDPVKPKVLHLSGSWGMSGQIAEGAAEAFARRFEQQGFKVKVGKLE